jgi:predicted DNA-binding helix-hairpin-helix protein
VNRATRAELLRVPGIGPRSADAIVAARRQATFTELAHLHRAGVHDVGRTSPYILQSSLCLSIFKEIRHSQ